MFRFRYCVATVLSGTKLRCDEYNDKVRFRSGPVSRVHLKVLLIGESFSMLGNSTIFKTICHDCAEPQIMSSTVLRSAYSVPYTILKAGIQEHNIGNHSGSYITRSLAAHLPHTLNPYGSSMGCMSQPEVPPRFKE